MTMKAFGITFEMQKGCSSMRRYLSKPLDLLRFLKTVEF